MASKRFLILSRLRRAIQKVRFLLSFSSTKWVLYSIIGSSSSSRRLSFKGQPSLLDCAADAMDDYYEAGSSFSISRTASPSSEISRTTSSGSEISRTRSDASSGDDIDKRAEIFIANFYRHIQMERQVSLELRYCGGNRELQRTTSE